MNPIISVVSGTYNRLGYLKSMVESVRKSVQTFPYEIVLVDGGSTDGTLEWCISQLDINLIEHGKLFGAVKAFNDGARAAEGKYVVLANDDIEFIDESLLSAYAFMEDNPTVGIGCFYQDRYGKPWHVDGMTAYTHDGKRSWAFYGQVCIVPRNLGNKVGWWGNYLKTYGGDNELSCNILELGYDIQPVPCACIHDTTPDDELRKENNPDVTKTNPDSAKWVKKWTRDGKLGPVLPEKWKSRRYDKQLRIIYAPIYEKDYTIQKSQKHGLRDAMEKIASVVEVDYVSTSMDYVHDVGLSFRPHIFIMQLHNPYFVETISAIRKEFPNAILVNWNGDYHPEVLISQEYMHYLKLFDLTGLVTTSVNSAYSQHDIDYFYWQIGYEDSSAVPEPETPKHDVVFMGNSYTQERVDFGKFLRRLPYDVGLYGFWNKEFMPNGNTLYNFDAGAMLYRNCKMAVSDSQWPHATGFVSNRLFQVMSAGTLMLQQDFDGMYDLLGLIDGEHLVVWKSFAELADKIRYFLYNDEERNKIAKAGELFVRENHSFDVRVKELLYELKKRGTDYTSLCK